MVVPSDQIPLWSVPLTSMSCTEFRPKESLSEAPAPLVIGA